MRRSKTRFIALSLPWLLLSLPVFAEEAATSVPSETSPPWNFWPTLDLGVPQPVRIGLEAHSDPMWRYFLDGGFIRLPAGGAKRSLGLFGLDLGGRWYPWGARFFLGGGMGYRRIDFWTDTSSYKIDDEVAVSDGNVYLHTVYVAPSVGAQFTLTEKLSIGFEAGVQLPIWALGRVILEDTSTGENSRNSEDLKVDSNRAMSRVAGLVLPQLTFLRLIWHLD